MFNSPGQNGPAGSAPLGVPNQLSSPVSKSGYTSNIVVPGVQSISTQNQAYSPISASGPPQLPATPASAPLQSQASIPAGMQVQQGNNSYANLSAQKPVFGLSLEELLKRDGSAIPLVVYQCIQAVDLYGLEVEGIYRLSGSSIHISKLKAAFDNGKSLLPDIIYNGGLSWQIQTNLTSVIRKLSITT